MTMLTRRNVRCAAMGKTLHCLVNQAFGCVKRRRVTRSRRRFVKFSLSRVGRTTPLARQRSHVISGSHACGIACLGFGVYGSGDQHGVLLLRHARLFLLLAPFVSDDLRASLWYPFHSDFTSPYSTAHQPQRAHLASARVPSRAGERQIQARLRRCYTRAMGRVAQGAPRACRSPWQPGPRRYSTAGWG